MASRRTPQRRAQGRVCLSAVRPLSLRGRRHGRAWQSAGSPVARSPWPMSPDAAPHARSRAGMRPASASAVVAPTRRLFLCLAVACSCAQLQPRTLRPAEMLCARAYKTMPIWRAVFVYTGQGGRPCITGLDACLDTQRQMAVPARVVGELACLAIWPPPRRVLQCPGNTTFHRTVATFRRPAPRLRGGKRGDRIPASGMGSTDQNKQKESTPDALLCCLFFFFLFKGSRLTGGFVF